MREEGGGLEVNWSRQVGKWEEGGVTDEVITVMGNVLNKGVDGVWDREKKNMWM